ARNCAASNFSVLFILLLNTHYEDIRRLKMLKKKALIAYDHSPMSKKGVAEAKNLAVMHALREIHLVSVMKLKSIGLQKLRNPQGDQTVVEGDFSREMSTLEEGFKADGIQAYSEVLIAGSN